MSGEQAAVRNPTVDIARALAALLVIIGHALAAQQWQGWLEELSHIASPLFFFLAGVYLTTQQPFRPWLWAKTDALLKPYLLLLLGWGVVHAWLGRLDWPDYLAGVLYATGATITVLPLWFLPHLLLALCCLPGVLALARRVRFDAQLLCWPALALVACAPWLMRVVPWPQGLPWSADLLPLSLPLLLAGYCLSAAVRQFSFRPLPCLLAVLVLLLLLQGDIAAIDMNRRVLVAPLVVLLLLVAGIYSVLCLASLLARGGALAALLAWFGRHSLLVLLFHLLWLRWLLRLLREHAVVLDGSWLAAVVLACALLCGLTIAAVQRLPLLSRLLLPVVQRTRPP